MISKINNISFKGVYFDNSINRMKQENINKLKTPIEMCNELYPDTDVFFGADNKGELVMRVQKGEPLVNLLDEDVVSAMKISPQDLYGLITAVIQAKYVHNSLWNIQEPYAMESIRNVDEMEPIEIAFKLNSLIKNFRKIHQKDLN